MFKDMPDAELIRAYGLLRQELRVRKIIRTKNLTGELGEYLAWISYNQSPDLPDLTLQPTNSKGIDAVNAIGERYAIKATAGNVTGTFHGLSEITSNQVEKPAFEYVIVVRFDDDHNLRSILELTWDQFVRFRRWHSTMQAWNLPLSRTVVSAAKVVYH